MTKTTFMMSLDSDIVEWAKIKYPRTLSPTVNDILIHIRNQEQLTPELTTIENMKSYLESKKKEKLNIQTQLSLIDTEIHEFNNKLMIEEQKKSSEAQRLIDEEARSVAEQKYYEQRKNIMPDRAVRENYNVAVSAGDVLKRDSIERDFPILRQLRIKGK